MTSIVDECLKSISQINQNDLDGEMAVCESMLESYEKIFSLMEHYSDDELSSLTFLESVIPTVTIQEADTGTNPAPTNPQPADQNADQNANDDDKKEKLWEFNPRGKNEKTGRKEHILKSIFLFIPRLILAVGRFIWRWIKSLFNRKGEADQAAKEASANLDKIAEANPTFFDNSENMQKLIDEMSEMDDYPAFTYVKEKNIVNNQQGAKNDTFGFILYPALNIDDLIKNLQDYDTGILKVFAEKLSRIGKVITVTNEDNSVSTQATQLTNDLVENMTSTLKEFSNVMNDELKVANAIRTEQKNTKSLIVQLPTGQSNESYSLPANLLWNKFSNINKIIEIINKDDETIVNIVKSITSEETHIIAPEDGSIQALKAMLNDLKSSTTIMLNQVKVIANLTDGFLNTSLKFRNYEALSAVVARLLGGSQAAPNPGASAENPSVPTDNGNKQGFFNRMLGRNNKPAVQNWLDGEFSEWNSAGNAIKLHAKYVGPENRWKDYQAKHLKQGNQIATSFLPIRVTQDPNNPNVIIDATSTKPIQMDLTAVQESFIDDSYTQDDNIEPLEY